MPQHLIRTDEDDLHDCSEETGAACSCNPSYLARCSECDQQGCEFCEGRGFLITHEWSEWVSMVLHKRVDPLDPTVEDDIEDLLGSLVDDDESPNE